jgi:hypothetical protein
LNNLPVHFKCAVCNDRQELKLIHETTVKSRRIAEKRAADDVLFVFILIQLFFALLK